MQPYTALAGKKEVRVEGLEPTRLAALDPKSSTSTNSVTPAQVDVPQSTSVI